MPWPCRGGRCARTSTSVRRANLGARHSSHSTRLCSEIAAASSPAGRAEARAPRGRATAEGEGKHREPPRLASSRLASPRCHLMDCLLTSQPSLPRHPRSTRQRPRSLFSFVESCRPRLRRRRPHCSRQTQSLRPSLRRLVQGELRRSRHRWQISSGRLMHASPLCSAGTRQ